MATLDELPASEDPVHLLLIADTKAGKSTYAAQAALAGFTMVYFDSDNGKSALMNTLQKDIEAMRRVHYFNIENPKEFWYHFLRSTTKASLRWNSRTHSVWGPTSMLSQPDDKIWTFDITKIPASWILNLDSWTSLASDALDIGTASAKAELLNGVNQSIYGEANSWVTYIANVLQKIPQHLIVQAHGTKYEIYEKPVNVKAGEAKQKEMILRDTVDVPVSSSRPHGYSMGSRFNHIGWLYVDALGNTEIDFTRKTNRVGGGPPNKKAPSHSLGFDKLVGKVPAKVDQSEYAGWHVESTHAELLAAIEEAKAARAAAQPTPGTTQAAAPASTGGFSLFKK